MRREVEDSPREEFTSCLSDPLVVLRVPTTRRFVAPFVVLPTPSVVELVRRVVEVTLFCDPFADGRLVADTPTEEPERLLL